MISEESAKEYYKYKKFLETAEYYHRHDWENSFQSFGRHKIIGDLLLQLNLILLSRLLILLIKI
jgi:hypothetical protein